MIVNVDSGGLERVFGGCQFTDANRMLSESGKIVQG